VRSRLSPVSSSTYLDAPGVHSLAGYVAIPPCALTDPESRAFSDSLLFESTDTVTGPEVTQHLPFTRAPERSQNMGALDKRLYISHHTPTDTVARVGPACVKLALNGCSYLQSTVRLSLQRDCTYNPHPCTVLTAAHNIHTRPPDAPARLAY